MLKPTQLALIQTAASQPGALLHASWTRTRGKNFYTLRYTSEHERGVLIRTMIWADYYEAVQVASAEFRRARRAVWIAA
jgi:hypothetical protein